jgi:hypothetical protein
MIQWRIKMKRALLISLLILCSGCAEHLGKFSIASTRPVDFSKHYKECATTAVGKDTQHVIILIPTGKIPTIAGAVENALQQSNAAFLTDGEVKRKVLWVLLYFRSWIEVKGTAWCEAADTPEGRPN